MEVPQYDLNIIMYVLTNQHSQMMVHIYFLPIFTAAKDEKYFKSLFNIIS